MPRNDRNVIMEGVRIFKPNFAGHETQYNRKGNRNFLVYLDDRVADEMAKDGWPIKFLQAREDDDGNKLAEQAFLKVAIRYGDFPPNVYLRTSRNTTRLSEADIDILDTADIVNVDLIVNPSNYDFNGNIGVKAYVKTMYVTIEEDYLQLKYAELDTARNHTEVVDD